MNEQLEKSKIKENHIDDVPRIKGSDKVKIILTNDFVTAYFFIQDVLSNVFKKSNEELLSIIQSCESNGESEVCRVTEARANKLLRKV